MSEVKQSVGGQRVDALPANSIGAVYALGRGGPVTAVLSRGLTEE